MINEQKNLLINFLENNPSDDDLHDFICKHKLDAKEVYIFDAERNSPDYCKGCTHILNHGFYPCVMCSRGKTDKYEKRVEIRE